MKYLFVGLLFIYCTNAVMAQNISEIERKFAIDRLSLNDEEERIYTKEHVTKFLTNVGELDDEVNIDSLFVNTIASLNINHNNTTFSKYLNVREGIFILFLLAITKDTSIHEIDFICPHMLQIKLVDVQIIEKWYLNNKSKLTWEAVKPAYNFFYRSGRMDRDEYFNLLLNGYDYTID